MLTVGIVKLYDFYDCFESDSYEINYLDEIDEDFDKVIIKFDISSNKDILRVIRLLKVKYKFDDFDIEYLFFDFYFNKHSKYTDAKLDRIRRLIKEYKKKPSIN